MKVLQCPHLYKTPKLENTAFSVSRSQMSKIPKGIAYCSILLYILTLAYMIHCVNNVCMCVYTLVSVLHSVGVRVKWNGQKAVS